MLNFKFDTFISASDANAAQTRSSAAAFNNQDNGTSHVGKTNFAVPAPPPLASGEKTRRLSDGDHFRQPNVTITGQSGHASVQKQLQEAQTQAQAQALADLILKVQCMIQQNFLNHSGL